MAKKLTDLDNVDFTQQDTFESSNEVLLPGIIKDNRPVNKEEENNEINIKSNSVKESFQRFVNGKLDPNQNSEWDSIKKHQKFNDSIREYEVIEAKNKKFESPLQTYNRLQNEITSFLSDLQTVEKEESSNYIIEQGIDVKTLIKEIETLKDQLEFNNLDENKNNKDSQISDTNVLISMLQQLSTKEKEGESSNNNNNNDESSSNVTYELYLNNSNTASKKANKDEEMKRFEEMERRLNSLETLVGNSSSGSNNSLVLNSKLPLIPLLEKIESNLTLLDDDTLSQLEERLKIVQQSLEKQEVSDDDNNPFISQEKQQIVDNLYQTTQSWNDIVEELPLLVGRLQTLQFIHQSRASFLSKMQELEQKQIKIESAFEIGNNQLQNVQQSFEENTKVIENNILLLNERLAKLENNLQ
eukprot:TRINITY_DN6424_c0_g1_i1.p1 TRINITY_DN6424_c0_g1~~TRINITY_DN6424_c0_g1_i1.p1  ORF type:complete len:414 (+),score=156.41 TRINITY_DN6424_c0_g1_i1:42-1283(+)